VGTQLGKEPEAFPNPRINIPPEYLRRLDHWLKAIEIGIMHERPVTAFGRHWRTPSLLTLQDADEWQN
jgi:hypothetical protein